MPVVLTMRSDFLGRPRPFPRLNDLLTANLQQVGPMQEHEFLRWAIEQPAFKVVAAELEPGLTERLLADVEGQPGALPLLQFTLDQLWMKGAGGGSLPRPTTTPSAASRGRSNTGPMRSMPACRTRRTRDARRRIFLRLVQPGEGVEDTKRRVAIEDLIALICACAKRVPAG